MAKSKKKRAFARLDSRGVVIEIIEERERIEDEWHSDLLASLTEVTAISPRPELGMVQLEGGSFGEPPPVQLPPEKMRLGAFNRGAKLRGATFPMDEDRWRRMTEVAQHVAMFNELPDGPKLSWPSEPPVTFTDPADFVSAYKALAAWRQRWHAFVDTGKDQPKEEIDE